MKGQDMNKRWIGIGACFSLTVALLSCGFASAATPASTSTSPLGGPGSFLAVVVHGPSSSTPTTSVQLISSSGVQRLTTLKGAMSLVAWSGDGRRALVEGEVRQGGPVVIELVNLPGGAVSPVALSSGYETQLLGFTRPRGLAILDVAIRDGGGWTLERRSLSGSNPVTLAKGVDAAAAVVSTADGWAYLVGAGGEVKLISNRVGVAQIVIPHSTGCQPVRMWSTTTFLAHCGDYMGRGRLEVLGVKGGTPQLIARDTAKPFATNAEAYPGKGGIYTRTEGACGSQWISHAGTNGVIKPIVNPGGSVEYSLLTSNGSNLAVVMTGTPCGSGSRTSLGWMNPETRSVHTIYTTAASPFAGFIAFPTYNGVE
jgi:hypothetical protein